MSTGDKPTHTYWPIAGLGAATRLAMIDWVGLDGFEDELMTDYKVFAKRATEPDSPFLNLPYVRIPGVKAAVSQSNAALKAIGRRAGLNGKTPEEEDRVDELLCNAMDLQTEYVKMSYVATKEQFPEWKNDFLSKSVPYYIFGLEKFMGVHGGKFLCGPNVTVADYKYWAYVEAVRILKGDAKRTDVVNGYPRLTGWVEGMDTLPSVKTYIASKYFKMAQNAESANWGNTPL